MHSIPISVSILSIHVQQPISLRKVDPLYIVEYLIACLEILTPHNNVQLKILVLDMEIPFKIRLDRLLEILRQRHHRCEQVSETEDICSQQNSDDSCVSTQFFKKQKNQLIDLRQDFELYCNVLLVFCFSIAKNEN